MDTQKDTESQAPAQAAPIAEQIQERRLAREYFAGRGDLGAVERVSKQIAGLECCEGRENNVDLDVPGAERRISLTIGVWKTYNGSPLIMVPPGVLAGDTYRNLWVISEGVGQIRMYTETQDALALNQHYSLSRWEAVDGAVEKVIGKTVASCEAGAASRVEG